MSFRASVLVLLSLIVGVALLPAPTASAASAAPTMSLTRIDGASFTTHGRTAQRSTTVYVQRWTGSAWSTVRKVTSKSYRYSSTIAPSATTRIRVVAAGRASPTLTATVAPPSLSLTRIDGASFTAHGRTSQRSATVHVQRWTGSAWSTVRSVASKDYRYSASISVSSTARIRAYVAGQSSAQSTATVAPPSLTLSRVEGGLSFMAQGRTAQRSTTVQVQGWTGSAWSTVQTLTSKDYAYSTSVTPTDTMRVRVQAGGQASTERTATIYSDDCGVRPHKTSTSLWSCTLVDDFDGDSLDRSVWVPQIYFETGSEAGRACYVDSDDNISVSGGALHLTVREEDEPVRCALDGSTTAYSAGMVSTYQTFSQKYGRFEARFRTTAATVPGLHEAFWLWPDDREVDVTQWPAAGEIDVAETYSTYPNLSIPFLHYTANDNGGAIPGTNTAWHCAADRGVYNTYRVDWTASSVKIYVNDELCLSNTSADPAFAQKYIVALTQALGAPGNEKTARTPLPATMDVDYVKVWE